MPPDDAGGRDPGLAVLGASAAAAARWTAAGRAALAADVSGRSGTRTACRETVGMLRIGEIGAGAGPAATGALCSTASGSGAGAGVAIGAADAALRAARRWTGAGMEPDAAAWTGLTRATTRPGVASGLTS